MNLSLDNHKMYYVIGAVLLIGAIVIGFLTMRKSITPLLTNNKWIAVVDCGSYVSNLYDAIKMATSFGGTLASFSQIKKSRIGFITTPAGSQSGSGNLSLTKDGLVCAYNGGNSSCSQNGAPPFLAQNAVSPTGVFPSTSTSLFVVFSDTVWQQIKSSFNTPSPSSSATINQKISQLQTAFSNGVSFSDS